MRAALLAQSGAACRRTRSAAVLLGLPTRPAWRDLVHVTRPGVTGSRTENGVKHHLAAFDDVDVTTVGALGVLGLARTAVDIGREHGYEDGVVAADAALRMGVPRPDAVAGPGPDDLLAARDRGPGGGRGSRTGVRRTWASRCCG